MKSLLVGNGIDNQYGGLDYFSDSITKRAIQNVKQGNHRQEDFPDNIIDHLQKLFMLTKELMQDRAKAIGIVYNKEHRV
jgi:hypothetical protein